jgi:hypothetical protein
MKGKPVATRLRSHVAGTHSLYRANAKNAAFVSVISENTRETLTRIQRCWLKKAVPLE